MKIPEFLEDLNIISKLGDNPGADNGLTAEGLKAKFDEAGLKLQNYLNDTLLVRLNEFLASEGILQEGFNMIGPIRMNQNKLSGLPDPTEAGDAVSLDYANRSYRASSWTPTAAQVGAAPVSHSTDKNNPHGVTAAQVGAAPASHATDKNNPHGVTASDVGALPTSGGKVTGDLTIEKGIPTVILDATTGSARFFKNANTSVDYGTLIEDAREDGKKATIFLDAAGGVTDALRFQMSALNATYNVLHTGNKNQITASDVGAVSKAKLWENAKLSDDFNGQTVWLDLSEYDGIEILYYVDETTGIYRNTGFMRANTTGVMYYVTASAGNRVHRTFTVYSNGIVFAAATSSSGAQAGTLCKPYQIFGIKGVK